MVKRQDFTDQSSLSAQINGVSSPVDDMVNEAVAAPTEEEKGRQALLDVLGTMRVSVEEDIPADLNTMRIGGVETFAFQGLNFIKAKAKQGKTSALALAMSVYISPRRKWGLLERISDEPLKVIYIDTEQKRYDTQALKKQVLKLAGITEKEVGDNFEIYNMRGVLDIKDKKDYIIALLENDHPQVLVIDGVVDLIANFNEVDESTELIKWLMYIADEYNVVLFGVLHTNKNMMDHNMRGHLGTMAEQKCDNTLECEKDIKTGIVTVKCSVSRRQPFPEGSWSFRWADDGNLIDAQAQRTAYLLAQAEQARQDRERKSQELKEERRQKMLEILKANGGSMSRKDLTEKLIEAFELKSRSSISPLITEWITNQVIDGNDKMIIIHQPNLFEGV